MKNPIILSELKAWKEKKNKKKKYIYIKPTNEINLSTIYIVEISQKLHNLKCETNFSINYGVPNMFYIVNSG